MLTIVVPERKLWDEQNEQFLYVKETALMLEHSLISISKWEETWCVPFLSNEKHTPEQMLDYIRCMTLNKAVDPNVYLCLTSENYQAIAKYIDAQRTASHVTRRNNKRKTSGEQVTSELIYYWLASLQIPFDPVQKWHLSRLLQLIDIADVKNNPDSKKKRPMKDVMRENKALNEARMAQHRTKG